MLNSRASWIVLAAVLCVVVSAVTTVADGPAVGPQIRIDVNGGTFSASETTGAVSDADPDVIIAGWNDWRASPTVSNEVIRTGVALSLDGGETWDDFVVRPPAAFQSGVEGDPMTAFDPRTGALWAGAISFSSPGGMYVARMDQGDGFFQPSVMVDTQGGVDKCWIVAGRNEVTPDSTKLYIGYNFGIVHSDDMGDSWSGPLSLGSGLGFLPRIGPNGEVYVAYWDWSQETFEVQRSLNGGTSFTTHHVATRMDTWGIETHNTRFPGTMRVPALLGLDVDRNTGTLYAVWPDTTDFSQGGDANVDVYFSKSDDQGDSWSTPVVLNGEGPFVGDQFFPWVEVDSTGRVHVLYLDSRHTDQNDNTVHGMLDAYYAYSEDGGDSWNETRLTPQSWDSDDDGLNRSSQFLGDYLGMGVTAHHAWPIYPDTHNGDADTYTNDINHCPSITEVQNLTVDKSADSRRLNVFWNDVADATGYVVYQDFAPTGDFSFVAGTGASGATGWGHSTAFGNRFYLVAGSTDCGVGPKR